MTPLLILTHGEFGAVLLGSAELMLGRQDGAIALALSPDETREDFAARVDRARADLKEKPLVLVDIACGTPWNVALMQGCAVDGGEILAGLSMPLLLEAMGLRATLSPRDLAAELVRLCPHSFARAAEYLAGDATGGCA
jgi:mannose/fructose-specific phosphotransferase system component IIA